MRTESRGSASLLMAATVLLASCGAHSTAPPLPTLSSRPATPTLSTPRTALATVSSIGRFEWHDIPQRDTTPLLDAKTDGQEIVWSTGAGTGSLYVAPDLYAYRSGSTPRAIFRCPDRDSLLLSIAVHSGRYAFVETNPRVLGPVGWRLFYLSGPLATPRLLDSGEPDADPPAPLPLPVFDDDRLVWSTVHRTPTGARSELVSFSLQSRAKTMIAAADAAATEYWFPALDGGRLAYGTVEHATGRSDRFHVYLLDLNAPAAGPRRLDTGGEATMPVIRGDTVVWKQTSNTVFNWGQLVRRSLSSTSESPIFFEAQPGLNYPSIGDRFVAAWGEDDTDFEILDLTNGHTLLLDRLSRTSPAGYVRPYLAGRLLVSILGSLDHDTHLQLRWTLLPPLG